MAYEGDKIKEQALEEYARSGRVMKAVADLPEFPSYPTLKKWKDNGEPHSVTGGKDWDVYLNEKRAAELEERKDLIVKKANERGNDITVVANEDIPIIQETIMDGIRSGEVELKVSDYIKLTETQIKLQNLDQQKIDFAEKFVTHVFGIIADEIPQDNIGLIDRIERRIHEYFQDTKSDLRTD
jgi:hypothetical protein